jgi:serine/threonine-protein kinase
MSRERWARLEPLIDAALDLPPSERSAYCDQVSTTDPALGAELRRLVNQPAATGSLFDAAADERSELVAQAVPAEAPAAEDLLSAVQASLGTRYIVEQELGGGGMSHVFVANEPALGRRVVVKLLSPELAAGINADRFAREIKLAASLQQANIVPLLATGTAAGCPYYTMPFVDGRSLRDRLERDGPLPIADGISILRDVARALAFAHGRGVVHRDVKPGNVLLSGGTAVVTDFGIAKAVAAATGAERPARSITADFTLTEAGSSIGTPAYMAPEQATGDPSIDHRADLYAFGCMAYEVFVGKPPFYGAPMHKIIAAHLQQTPRPLSDHRAGVPSSVVQVITRCLEKDPALRPQTAAEILTALDLPNAEPEPRLAPTPAPQTRRRTPLIAAAVVIGIAATAAIAYVASNRAPPEPLTLAAIPFRNLAHDTALDYRSDGIRDEILTALARVPGVQIVGRSAAYRYKDNLDGSDVRTVARDLGVRLVVTGTLRENNGKVTISAQLNDSTTRAELWADTFVRDSKDFGSIADDIVHTITDTLRARFGNRVHPPQRVASTAGTTNAEALDLYLLGQEQLKRRGAGVRQSVASFEQAIRLDPKFARAYAALASALQLYPYFVGTRPEDVKDTTIAIANRALALDSTLADPHVALGTAYAHDGRWDLALAELKRGVELDPGDVAARAQYGRYLITTGRSREAIPQLLEARRIERVSPLSSGWLAYAYYALGQLDSAALECERSILLDSTFLPATNVTMLVRFTQGRLDDAHRIALAAPPGVMTNAPWLLARLGDTANANRLIQAMQAQTPRPWFADVAEAGVELARGDSAAALERLERSQREIGPVWSEYFPIFTEPYDLVRGSPRFEALVRQANLDPVRFERPPVTAQR